MEQNLKNQNLQSNKLHRKDFSKKDKSEDIIVNTLPEFIASLEQFPNSKFFYRGENGFYQEREAKAFRSCKGGWQDKYNDYLPLIEQFYSETAYRLTDVEKDNFLAFAQHYGLPTNLIDVSVSPLTALFFACDGGSDEGFVYTFDNEFIDITSIVQKNPKKNFIQLMLELDVDTIGNFASSLQKYYDLYPASFKIHFDTLNKETCPHMHFNAEINADEDSDDGVFHHEFVQPAVREAVDRVFGHFSTSLSGDVFTYLVRMIDLLMTWNNVQDTVFWLNFLPTLVYKPQILFERARLQHGFFLVQAHMQYIEGTYNYCVLARQRIKFNRRIKITNTLKILKDLDNLGVNRGTIYGDFDNIARYLYTKANEVTP